MIDGDFASIRARFDLFREALIRTDLVGSGTTLLSLPQVLAALMADNVIAFPALRAHQAPAWRAFLVQAAVMGVEAMGLDTAPGSDEQAWADVLRALTPRCEDTAWCLIAPPDKPAFFQPPVPDIAGFSGEALCPDEIDVLVTSKNHDAKAARAADSTSDDWVFALVSLQTQEGVMGAGNYGIARMNGGYGSRPYIMVRPAIGTGFWSGVRRDVAALVRQRARWRTRARDRGFGESRELKLLWTLPWAGRDPLTIGELHPLFIEVCRRVRLQERNGQIVARRAASQVPRVDAKTLKGDLDDPWGAVDLAENKLMSLSGAGFSYKRVVELISKTSERRYRRGLLSEAQGDEIQTTLILDMFALARGQGKTEGFHIRSLTIPEKRARVLQEGGVDDFSRIADLRIAAAAAATSKALRPALIVLVQKGPDEASWKKPSNEALTGPWLARFENAVDEAFFPALWRDLDFETEAAREKAWAQDLARMARNVLTQAMEAAPRGDQRRFLAEARATNVLEGGLRNALPALREVKESAHA